MKKIINCFIPYLGNEQVNETIKSLKTSELINKIFLLSENNCKETVDGCEVISIDSLKSSTTIKIIASKSDTPYTLIYTKSADLRFGMFALDRILQIATDSNAGLIYTDHYQITDDKRSNSPVIAYQKGSLRDDFNFGSVLFYKTEQLKNAVNKMDKEYKFAGLYDLRLKVSQNSDLIHINEYLYTEIENDTRKSGEKVFDYVDPKNRDVQIEMELACTDHLKEIGAYLVPKFKKIEFNQQNFECEATVIIPVRDRIRTIADAIESVLNQKTNFKFNLIVVDNYSTDGTSEAIKKFASDKRLIHLIPENKELGIGGCWNAGVHHSKCGKFSIQLDSDDVYSDENTLQKIVDTFYEQNCAMVVGTYKLTDFDMNTIPPGIIDHKEWTPENGRNNALRINGLGAPRAFYTPLLREIKVPNTSYGEDYALGLYFSREYQIGRIYDVLYLCRRWDDNSDASLDIVKMNAHNTYKDRIRTWELEARIAFNKKTINNISIKLRIMILTSQQAKDLLKDQLDTWNLATNNYNALKQVKTKELSFEGFTIKVQFNPSRIQSSAAKVDSKSIQEREMLSLFEESTTSTKGIPFGKRYQLLVNPFPIFSQHFTIPTYKHEDQLILNKYEDMLDLAKSLDEYIIFYNGPKCGASAPDHAHFQAGNKNFLPIEKDVQNVSKTIIHEANNIKVYTLDNYLRNSFFVESMNRDSTVEFFKHLYFSLDIPKGEKEPMMNVISWFETNCWYSCIIPRRKHRPSCFDKEGDANILLSPASVDMGGVFITPLEKDFKKITCNDVKEILEEVCLSDQQMDEIVYKIKSY